MKKKNIDKEKILDLIKHGATQYHLYRLGYNHNDLYVHLTKKEKKMARDYHFTILRNIFES